MLIPIRYNVRHLIDRWTSTLSTVLSFALVVGVFVVVTSLAVGLDRAFLSTGDPLNLLIMRTGAQAELQSGTSVQVAQIVRNLRGIATDEDGVPLVSPEVVTVVNKPKRGDGKRTNLQIRGLDLQGVKLRPEVRIVEGRMFKPGMREVVVSERVAARFENYGLDEHPHMGKGEWTVVGTFDAGGSAYDSEVWCDYQELMQEFNRPWISTIAVRAKDAVAAESLARLVNDDVRLQLGARSERAYFAEQTEASRPLKAFGVSLAVVMSIGACFAGMNAMYASISNRAKEIGTLRVLGFKPGAIVVCFMIESVLIALVGGALGCVAAYPMNWVSAGTINQQTYSEVIFNLAVTPGLMGVGLAFAVVMGLVGGLLPAVSASRRPIIEAMAKH